MRVQEIIKLLKKHNPKAVTDFELLEYGAENQIPIGCDKVYLPPEIRPYITFMSSDADGYSYLHTEIKGGAE